MKIFVTHNPEDREMYFRWAMEPLRGLGEVVLYPTDRNLTTPGLPGVVATPHLGELTVHAARPQTMGPVEQIQAILDGQVPPRAVNPVHASRLQAYWQRN